MKALAPFTIYALFIVLIFSGFKDNPGSNHESLVRAQIPLEANAMRSFIWNSGIFNQDIRTNNTPGCEWPKNSGKFVVFTTGLTVAAYVNNQLKMSAGSYLGEYVPGYCINGVLQTNANFKLYRVTRGDNQNTNPDWANWGLMVPYGAPYKDNNSNGIYEPAIDVPGVKDAAQTVFICMTDADPTAHTPSEGFGGGTTPLFNEVHFTAWCYDNTGYEAMQFFKWVVVNKNTTAWDSTMISIVSDPDVGDASDDYIGCDTTRQLGFCYNSDNMDGNGSGVSYGPNPPAVGMMFLNCNNSNARLTSFDYFTNSGSPGPVCERDPTNPSEAYWFMKGFKKDGTPWINIQNLQPTKFCYTYPGWMESMGRIENCGGSLGGPIMPSPSGDRRTVMSYKPSNQRLMPGDSQVVIAAQFVTRGNNNINSLVMLLGAADAAKNLCENGFVLGMNPISIEIPNRFNLYQNYPNPFNPITKIKFDLPKSDNVTIKIYDAIGREITTLVNEKLNAGVYSVDWDAANYPSGVYFYKLQSGEYADTRKMVLVK